MRTKVRLHGSVRRSSLAAAPYGARLPTSYAHGLSARCRPGDAELAFRARKARGLRCPGDAHRAFRARNASSTDLVLGAAPVMPNLHLGLETRANIFRTIGFRLKPAP